MRTIELLENLVMDCNELLNHQIYDTETYFHFGSDGYSIVLYFGDDQILDDDTPYSKSDEQEYENDEISYKTLLLRTLVNELEKKELDIQTAKYVVSEVLSKMVK